MKSTKTFNNISAKLKSEIPKLKPGQVVTFQMLNGVANPDPDPREASKDPILYGKRQVRTNFRIFDPYNQVSKDSEGNDVYTGADVEVGCVDTWNGDNPERFTMLVPGYDMGSKFQGKFSLTGGKRNGSIYEDDLFEILWLSPEREGSPFQDGSTKPLFKMIDLKAESRQSVSLVKTLKKALDYAESITEEKARQIFSALNKPTYQDTEVLMAKIGEFARTEPNLFIDVYESKDTSRKSLIKEALDAEVITHDFASGQVKMGGQLLATFKAESSEAFINDFSKYIITSENGADVLANIENQLSKKREKQSVK